MARLPCAPFREQLQGSEGVSGGEDESDLGQCLHYGQISSRFFDARGQELGWGGGGGDRCEWRSPNYGFLSLPTGAFTPPESRVCGTAKLCFMKGFFFPFLFSSTLVRDSRQKAWQRPGLLHQLRQRMGLNREQSEALFQHCRAGK